MAVEETSNGVRTLRMTPPQITAILIAAVVYGIILAFVAPMYSDYSARAGTAEGLNLASSAKVAITDYYAKYQAFPPDNATAGIAKPTDIQGNAVNRVEISTVGTGEQAKALITITYNKRVYKDKTLVVSMLPQGDGLSINCYGGTLPDVYRPRECHDPNNMIKANDQGTMGWLGFIFCLLLVKCVSVICIKKYSVVLFILEVIAAIVLFQIIDYYYVIYFSPFYPSDTFWLVQPFVYLLFGLFLGLVFEVFIYPLMCKFLKKKNA